MKSTSLTKPFLLEIGVEELPSDALLVLRTDLKKRLSGWLAHKNLVIDKNDPKIVVETTPRRIIVFIPALPIKQADRSEELVGPSVKNAYAENGEPTQALLGFVKAKGARLEDVFKKVTPKGEQIAVKLLTKGLSTEKVLKELTPEVFSGFLFPKRMRWNADVTFPRPIRWILALWGKEILPFKYAGLTSDRFTYGHRFLAPQAIRITQADLKELETKLKKAHVTISYEKRMDAVRTELKKWNPAAKIDETLVEISSCLTEDIAFIRGEFDGRFLELPDEILATSMRKHQKIFVLYDKTGRILPKFLAVVNGKKAKPGLIQKNYENVLEAKLKDAEFFYKEDTRSNLEEKVESLAKVTFLGKLGTLYEKTKRLRELSEVIAGELGLSGAEVDQLKRAALLSKADLVTHMVYEFPELQGFVGSLYARKESEAESVVNALKDYYLPLSLQSEDPLNLEGLTPDTFGRVRLVGALLGILDKLDTLVGAYGIGLEVSGSEDPYALRRAANGIVQTVFELKKRKLRDVRFSLGKLIERSVQLYGDKLKFKIEDVRPKLKKLFEDRISWILAGERPRDKELLTGIFISSSDDLAEIWDRFHFLRSLEKGESKLFFQTYKILERTRNISKGAGSIERRIDENRLQAEEEKSLYQAYRGIESEFARLAGEKNYPQATKLYAEALYDRIHAFFDRVLVNVDDPNLKQNRLALMASISDLYVNAIADLSVVAQVAEP